jgi:non-specific serine/threonine protein kinase
MLRRLSTFRGGWTLNAAETITVGGTINEDDVLDLISQLEDKSLIVSHMMGQPRYAMLETIRQYAKEKLEQSGEAPELETRHAAWCLDLAGEAQQGLDGSEQERWLDRLATEADNIRAALRRCAQSRHVTPGLRLAIALRGYWHLQGRFAEGRLLLGPLLDAEPRDPVEPELRATAHNAAGGLAYYQGDLAAARASFEHVVDHRRGEGGELPLARALHNLANVHRSLGAIVESRRLFEESLTLKRATGTPQDITFATRDLGVLELACSNYDTSRSLLQESLSIERASGRTVGLAETLCALAHVAVYVGDGHLARQLGEESLELCRSLGSRLREADALEILGEEALERGAHEDGLRFFEQAIDIQEDLGNELGFMRTTAGSGLAFLCLGDDRRAVAALDVALSIAEKIGDRRGMARCHLFYGAANEGTPGSSTARARSYEQALDIGQELHASWMILGALEGIAGLAAGQGRPAWALKLLSAAESQRRRLGIPRLHARDAGHAFDAHVEGCRQALADNEFEAAWDAGRNLTLDEAAQAASE